MKIVARTTAVIFLILGLLVILLGLFIMFGDFVKGSQTPTDLFFPELASILRMAQFYAGGVVALQGLFLSAIGEGIWLLADVAAQTAAASNALLRLTNRQR